MSAGMLGRRRTRGGGGGGGQCAQTSAAAGEGCAAAEAKDTIAARHQGQVQPIQIVFLNCSSSLSQVLSVAVKKRVILASTLAFL